MIFAEATLTEAGGTAAIVAAILSGVVSIYATRIRSKAKRGEMEVSTIEATQAILDRGLQWTEEHAIRLRKDLDEAMTKIDTLTRSLTSANRRIDELVANEDECQRRLLVLTAEVKQLRGGAA